MKATVIFIMSLIAALSLFSCNDTQSSSAPVEPNGLGQQDFEKPTAINITALLCADPDPSTTVGTWESSGLFEDMGDASSQASVHGSSNNPPRLVEGKLLLESQAGTITIRFVEPHSLPNPGLPVLD